MVKITNNSVNGIYDVIQAMADTVQDLNSSELRRVAMGSEVYVIGTGDTYVKNSAGQWIKKGTGSGSGSGSNTTVVTGADGKSAYDIAREHGFEGTETEWLFSLSPSIGENGHWVINGVDSGIRAGYGDPIQPDFIKQLFEEE